MSTEVREPASVAKRYVRIRCGANVGMDFCYWTWPDLPKVERSDMLFEAVSVGANRVKLTADGFGVMERGKYGNGAIYADEESIIDLK